MPELPEVETVMRGLLPVVEGARIEKMELRRPDLRAPIPPKLVKRMQGSVVLRLERRSKYILWHMTHAKYTPFVMITHLGMSGRFSLHCIPPEGYLKHDHVVWYLEDGRQLVYHDPRRFGVIDWAEAAKLDSHPLLAHLGPEPLYRAFNANYLMRVLAKKSQAIKVVLMDASVVVGVGNIYASEACFLAKIHPETSANQLQPDQLKALVSAVKQVLRRAIDSGGSSLRDFWHVDGRGGYFQHQFNVYGRKAETCLVCGQPIQLITQAGRSTFFCKICQAK